MEQAKLLAMAIGSVLITLALTGVIGLLVARHLDNKRTHTRRTSIAEADDEDSS